MGIYPPPKLGQLRRRDVPEGLISDMRGVSARCLFLPLADIGCGTFMSIRPSPGSAAWTRWVAVAARRFPSPRLLAQEGRALAASVIIELALPGPQPDEIAVPLDLRIHHARTRAAEAAVGP